MEKLKKAALKKILHNCRKATYLIEKRQLENITLKETWELELHLKGCHVCQTYVKQSMLINDWISELFRNNDSDLHLDSGFKKKLQQDIDAILEGKKLKGSLDPCSSLA